MNNFYRLLGRLALMLVLITLLAGCAAIPAAQSNPPNDNRDADSPIAQPAATNEVMQQVYIPQVNGSDPGAGSGAYPAPADTPIPARTDRLPPERWQEWPVIPEVSAYAQAIYQAGIADGRDPRKFAKVGDCQNITQYFLGLFDRPDVYVLGESYAYLQPTIDYYAGNWSRKSAAVRTGFNVASVLSPINADPETCSSGETPLACEFRLQNPSFALISMETWPVDRPVELYEQYLRQIVDYAIAYHVMPIVATKADNLEGNHAINQAVARVAYDYDIPMWNFWREVQPLPSQGLLEDAFHLTNGSSHFDDAEAMQAAWPHRNLSALQVIDAVRKAVGAQ